MCHTKPSIYNVSSITKQHLADDKSPGGDAGKNKPIILRDNVFNSQSLSQNAGDVDALVG